jgi:tRNA A37 threonylcarbamoyltransferase TsaD
MFTSSSSPVSATLPSRPPRAWPPASPPTSRPPVARLRTIAPDKNLRGELLRPLRIAHKLQLAGGVAANSRLRLKLQQWSQRTGTPVSLPSMKLCTDNAAMVAAAGYHKACRTGWDDLDLNVFSAMPVAEHV